MKHMLESLGAVHTLTHGYICLNKKSTCIKNASANFDINKI